MCTIIAAVGVWPESPLVIAANRDEALDRPASPPVVWAAGELAERRVLAPRDLRAGGTWLGLNDAGVFVGITNRRARNDPKRRSRGELVTMALGADSPSAALAQIRELEPSDYNPFHLLVADRGGAQVIWGDGQALHELEFGPGIHWITERSFDAAASGRHASLTALTAGLRAEPMPTPERWRELLADHGRSRKGAVKQPRAWSVSLDAMCVHARPLNYGTRSSTYVQLGQTHDTVRLLHGHGRPCETEWVDYGDELDDLHGG